jgi:hypothetical protein
MAEYPYPEIDANKPNAARMYEYMLGGKENFEADRSAVETMRKIAPDLSASAWANRSFHLCAAELMAGVGLTQFIDIGCGLLTMENTHEVVRRVIPSARVAYIDYDPGVVSHGRALLADDAALTVIRGDIRDPAGILSAVRDDGLIDPGEPCGVLVTAVLHFVPDIDDPCGVVTRLTAALAPGSYFALSHFTNEGVVRDRVHNNLEVYSSASAQLNPRDRVEVTRFFAGLELLPPWPGAAPGVSKAGMWGRTQPPDPSEAALGSWWAGVGRKAS